VISCVIEFGARCSKKLSGKRIPPIIVFGDEHYMLGWLILFIYPNGWS